MEFSEWEDSQLFQALDDAEIAHKFEVSDDWKMFRELCRRIAEKSIRRLINGPGLKDDGVSDEELRVLIKFYSNVVANFTNQIKQEAMVAFEEAKTRGLITSLSGTTR